MLADPKSVIIFVHIRKCAGTSFKAALAEQYGERLFLDYGDQIGSSAPSSIAKRGARLQWAKERKSEYETRYDILHGHFYAEKYDFLDRPRSYATILRDPVERVVSNYLYWTRKNNKNNPVSKHLNEQNLSLEDYAALPDSRNVQATFLSKTPLENFSFVGLFEDMNRTVNRFNATFATNIKVQQYENANPERKGRYDLPDKTRKLIASLNERDMDLYERATKMATRA